MLIDRKTRVRGAQGGYIMMMLLLTLALMAIVAAIVSTEISFSIKRDREEEMIHRGVQYSRAIRAYYKKFGRYPAKIEDLENTSQIRFLRKRYKDPLMCKAGKCADFKLLHYGEAKLSMGMGMSMIQGANTLGSNGALTPASGLSQNTSFGGGIASGPASTFGQNQFGQNPQATNTPSTPPDPNAAGDPSQAGTQATPGTPGAPTQGTGLNGNSGDKLSNTSFGGAPIVGVASTSKEKTIREFDKKKKYNEWQFVYDPTLDRGMLITTPYQPQQGQFGMQGVQNVNGTSGQNGSGQNGSSPFGNSFGNNSNNGFGNNSAGIGNNSGNSGTQNNNGQGFGNPSQPSNPPPQQ